MDEKNKSWRNKSAERLDRLCDPLSSIIGSGPIDRNPNPIWRNKNWQRIVISDDQILKSKSTNQ